MARRKYEAIHGLWRHERETGTGRKGCVWSVTQCEDSQEQRTCTRCHQMLPLAAYYRKGTTWESRCKECKKATRAGGRTQEPVAHPDPLEKPSRGFSRQPQPSFVIEPETLSQTGITRDIDFSMWERRYGHPLSEVERIEIRHNLMGLIKLLIHESEKGGDGGAKTARSTISLSQSSGKNSSPLSSRH